MRGSILSRPKIRQTTPTSSQVPTCGGTEMAGRNKVWKQVNGVVAEKMSVCPTWRSGGQDTPPRPAQWHSRKAERRPAHTQVYSCCGICTQCEILFGFVCQLPSLSAKHQTLGIDQTQVHQSRCETHLQICIEFRMSKFWKMDNIASTNAPKRGFKC